MSEIVQSAQPPEGNFDVAQDSGNDRLAELLEQYSGETGYRAQVERIDPIEGPTYLGTIAFDEQLHAVVQQKWGGGKYSGKIVGPGSKYVGRIPHFRIAGLARDPSYQQPAAAPAEHQPQQLGAIIISALDSFKTAIVEAVRSVAPHPAPAVDPLATVTAIAGLMKELQPKAPPRESMKDLIETMSAMHELRDKLGGTGQGGGVAEAVQAFAPIVHRVLESQQLQAPQGQPATEIAPEPQQTMRTAAPATPPVAAWIAPFMGYKHTLLNLADAGKAPALYADLVIDNLSDAQAQAIADAEAAGTLDNDLFTAIPELHRSPERRAFGARLLAAIRDGLFEPEQPEPAKRAKGGKKRPARSASSNGNGAAAHV